MLLEEIQLMKSRMVVDHYADEVEESCGSKNVSTKKHK